MQRYFNEGLKGKHIAIWGLAFKPNTDDIREAPALYVIDELLSLGCTISVFDPEAMGNVRNLLKDKVQYAESQYEAIQGADALVIATEWNEFRTPDFIKMVKGMKNKAIFDGRNLFDMNAIKELGFHYECIGRGNVQKINQQL